MTIRPGCVADRTRAVELLRDSHRAAGFDGGGGFVFPFDCAYAARLFVAHLGQASACCLVLEVAGRAQGLLLATAGEHPFGPVRLAREIVWWIDPAHRGRSAIAMLDAYEAWAASRQCAFVGVAGMGDDPDVAKLYLRRGYFAAERHFLKGL
ncbi:GNAT family N-acetyltransferase [Bradyrhizobium sp. 1050_B9_N1_2]|uniref:GNAT family N-acetyltransferase n=1 Tax=Bradyrhizobium sp. 1050_B9_N1_2 TaxID=3238688 RepID=UPI003EDBABE1